MNCARYILSLILLLTTTIAGARESNDSLVLNRIFNYQRNYTNGISGYSTNFYSKFVYNTHRRNFGLLIIPNMYAIAKGERTFLSEQYGRLHIYDLNDYEHENQVYYTTIPRNRRAMPVLTEFLTPSIYSVLVYGNHILSPFHKDNRHYYHYSVSQLGSGMVRVYFHPRYVKNTQLMEGMATVDYRTGRIMTIVFEGEYDLIHFRTMLTMGREGSRSLLPNFNHSDISFKFAGNHITSSFEAVFDCPIRLADTVSVRGDRHLIDSVRPIALSDEELAIYEMYDLKHAPKPAAEEDEEENNYMTETEDSTLFADNDSTAIDERSLAQETAAGTDTENVAGTDAEHVAVEAAEDSIPPKRRRKNILSEALDLLADHLLSSHRAEAANYYIKFSPILEPQYVSYSGSKGLSYKMNFRAEYYFNHNSGIYLTPNFGYNFKQHKFYFTAPLRYIYNQNSNSFVELVWRNGNRIGNSSVLDEILAEQGPITLPDDLNSFDDEEIHIYNNTRLYEDFNLEAGIVYHNRQAVNAEGMRFFGKKVTYRSIAPAIGVKVRPWRRGPMFAVDYERTLQSRHSSSRYERWEVDASIRRYITSLQTINLRLGGGLYTMREGSYFTDFANFRDNNLPEGWNDDWSGNFQLLDSRLYNVSQYYVRSNVSYESPLLFTAFVPLVGRYVEQERFYWSGLLIEHARPYSELGYGFSTRFFSLGLFTSFHNIEFQQFGTKFTFELFKRW